MNQLERDIRFGGQHEETHQHNNTQADGQAEKSVMKIKIVPFPPEFNWELQNFNEDNALKTFSQLANQDIKLEKANQGSTSITAVQATTKGSGLTKNTSFILRGSDSVHGIVEIVRKYSDIFQLRQALVRRWPGCLIPPIPQLGNIGKNEKQINRNKMELINSFLKRLSKNQNIFASEQLQIFMKSPENQVAQNLQKLKTAPYDQLLANYKQNWPECFQETSEEEMKKSQQYIKNFEEYFTEKKFELNYQKDEVKRLAELRTKFNSHRYNMLYKLLPEYEEICLDWFVKKQQNKEQKKQQGRIYSSQKYQSALQAYKDDLFPNEDDSKQNWLIYEMMKFEQKQIDCTLQAINHYKYILNEYKYFSRNIDNNTKQLQDINNKKLSLKIFLLSGTEDDKKTQLANQTIYLQKSLRTVDQFYKGVTNLLHRSLQEFQSQRCQFYKKKMIGAFKKQAIYMAKLFSLYVETQRI